MSKRKKIALYTLPDLREGIFLNRPNRFASEIRYNGHIDTAHIHDPGRLKELLIKGTKVLFTDSNGKLTYYVKAVWKEDEWVLIDSAQHSKIAFEVFKHLPEFKAVKEIKKEVKLGKSRIDFVLDGTPLEVKGASLVKDGVALFPDAPTKRGTRHVGEIIDHNGIILILVMRSAEKFAPYKERDPDFTVKLSEARKKKIPIIPVQISFDGETIYYEGKIPLADF